MPTTDQNAWVQRVLGVQLSASLVSAGLLSARDVTARLMAQRERIAKLPRPEVFATDLREAALALKVPDLPRALALTEELEARVTAAERAAGAAGEIAGALPEQVGGAVVFAKLRLALEAAVAGRRVAVKNLQRACLATLNEFHDDAGDGQPEDPLIAEARAAVGTVETLFPSMDPVRAAMDDLIGAPPDQRDRLMKTIVARIDAYAAEIDREPMYRELEASAVGTLPIHGAVHQALSDLRKALSG
jgi:hypothetical protein